jgi:hypothetical protein
LQAAQVAVDEQSLVRAIVVEPREDELALVG